MATDRSRIRRWILPVGVLLAILGLSGLYLRPGAEVAVPAPAAARALAEVSRPELAGEAEMGARAFTAFCASCHGETAGGLAGKGPPLIHRIYEPGHHGDGAIMAAVRNGSRAHHWPFGDMPPVEGITDAEIGSIIAFIRAVQKANGIF